MGLPILPTVFTLYFAIFKIFSIILQVVDFPFVPVIETTNASLLRSKNKSRSVIILFKFLRALGFSSLVNIDARPLIIFLKFKINENIFRQITRS